MTDMELTTRKVLEWIKERKISPEEGARMLQTLRQRARDAEKAAPNQPVQQGSRVPEQPPADPTHLRSMVEEYLKRTLAAETKLPVGKINVRERLGHYGIDSMMIMRITRSLENDLGPLPKTLFFQYQTLAALAGYFTEHHGERIMHLLEPEKEEATVASVAGPLIVDRTAKASPDEGIAIIGLSGRYPSAENLQEFWEILKNGTNCITEIPAERWDWRLMYDPDKSQKGKSYSKWGGFLSDVSKFDPLFFGITPREAELMDPQERLFLETCWHTLEDAGYTREVLESSRVGVFTAVMYGHYQFLGNEQQKPNSLFSSVANRVSYFCNFHGPSIALDTMCSGSLTAIHLACNSIRLGECDMAIAGGVNLTIHPHKYELLSQSQVLSSDGLCRSFGEGGDGYVPGEGVGAVLLKPLHLAIRDGDYIYGVIRATAVNHGGRTNGYTVPNPNAQGNLVAQVIRQAKIDPRTITYMEGHGTGTALGDPVEVNGLVQAFGEPSDGRLYCAIGSVKSNIGHLEAAAGIASLTKVLLQMKHKTLVPSLHADTLNANIDFSRTPFHVQRTLQPWESLLAEKGPVPRRAAVNGFGAGGSNGHMIVEEYVPAAGGEPARTPDCTAAHLFVLSARTETQLRESARQFLRFLSREVRTSQVPDLIRVAYTLQTGREAMEHRLAIAADACEQLQARLAGYLQNEPVLEGVYCGCTSQSGEMQQRVHQGSTYTAEQLAIAWTGGAEIAWNQLYPGARPQKLPLPGYPFAREHYWIKPSANGQGSAPRPNVPNVEAVRLPAVPENVLYFGVEWERANLQAHGSALDARVILLFAESGGTSAELGPMLRNAFPSTTVVTVVPSHTFGAPAPLTFGINPKEPEHYRMLLAELGRTGHYPQQIVHLWSLTGSIPASAEQLLEQTQFEGDRGVYSALYLLQAVHELKAATKARCLFFVSERAPHHQAVSGFARALSAATNRFDLVSIRVPGEMRDPSLLLPVIKAEMTAETGSTAEVRYENGNRFVRGVSLVNPATTRAIASPVRQGGTYIITGGCGGLGMIMARHLARTYRARLVLTGRTLYNETIASKLQELTAMGGEAMYCQADVARLEDAHRLVRAARERFGPIHGVIHSAGVAGDSKATESDRAEFARVLEPKGIGTLHLDLATEVEPLDFFVLFSSVSAFIGDFGRCSYSVANAFLDHYAHFRQALGRPGRTVSINWPAWSEGGMEMNGKEAAAYFQSLHSLSTEAGIAAFEYALCSDRAQLVVACGDRHRVEQILRENPLRQRAVSPASTVRPAGSDGVAEKELFEASVRYLRKLIAHTTNIAESRIELHTSFGSYGIDSIMINEMNQQLERLFPRVPATLFFEYDTLQNLAHYFVRQYPNQLWEVSGLPSKTGSQAADRGDTQEGDRVTMRHRAGTSPADVVRSVPRHADPVAIVGLAGRYPMAPTLAEFWENLKQGRDCISEVPPDRWSLHEHYDPDRTKKGKTYSKWGGFLEDVDQFDPLFFQIAKREAELMDPLERLFLQAAWSTVEDAGYARQSLAGERVGVVVGALPSLYNVCAAENPSTLMTGLPASLAHGIANRVSYAMNFSGPSLTVDTACSSSLEAIRLACQQIQTGACDVAIAGAVNLSLHPYKYIWLSQSGFLSPTGRCQSFSENGDGYVPGEGVGAVLLKPLSRAVKDGDHIYGVIRAATINHGGHMSGYTVPNPNAQARLIGEAIAQAGGSARTINYIEAHGAGTPLGDPIEVAGLTRAFEQSTSEKQFCAIGSVKSNIGHLEGAAGMAGLTKVLLQLKHKQLVPSLHARRINPRIRFEETPFRLQQELGDWPQPVEIVNGVPVPQPRRAGISSFGAGGTNLHLIVEEYIPVDSDQYGQKAASGGSRLVVLSARSKEQLRQQARQLAEFLQPEKGCAGSTATLKQELARQVASLLNVAASEISADDTWMDCSMDVIHMDRLAEQIEEQYAVHVGPSEFARFDHISALAEFIAGHQRNSLELSLESLAYTLQVGREPMDERLAVTVSDLGELRTKLADFARGVESIPSLVPANVKEQGKGLQLLFDASDEAEEYVRKLMSNRNLGKIALLWLAGVEVDWASLYPAGTPHRVSLPTYPFAQERCWLPTGPKVTSVATEMPVSTPHFFRTAWAPSQQPTPVKQGNGGPVLVFAPPGASAETVQHRVRELCGPETAVHTVRLGHGFNRSAAADWQVAPSQTADYMQLWNHLGQAGSLPSTVICLWPFAVQGKRVAYSEAAASEWLALGLEPVFHLLQAMNQSPSQSPLRILFVYPGGGTDTEPWMAAAAGYARSVGLVFPQVAFSAVGVDAETSWEEALRLAIGELGAKLTGVEPEVRYQAGRRHIRQVVPLDLPASEGLPIRDGGVYLITGGLGALGLLCAKHVASKARVKLVLIGRSPLSAAKQQRLQELERMGSQVIYLQADIAQEGEIAAALDTVRAQFGALNGLLHAAGQMTGDKVTEKRLDQFRKTLRPKVHGTVVLDQLTTADPLDFFVLFSSTSALLGDFGQCDYAIGNRFLDSFAEWRESLRAEGVRKGRTITINWPLWRDGGIYRDQTAEEAYLRSSGVSYLEAAAGLNAMDCIAGSGERQVVVIPGDRRRIERVLGVKQETAAVNGAPAQSALSAAGVALATASPPKVVEHEPLDLWVEGELVRLAAGILRIEPERLDVTVNLGDYGFESIYLKELALAINDTLGCDVMPTLFFANSTVRAVSRHLVEQYSGQLRSCRQAVLAGGTAEGVEPPPSAPVAQPEPTLTTQQVPMAVQPSESTLAETRGETGKVPVAIIGTSGVMPQSKDLREFWKHLAESDDLITEIPAERWDWRDYYSGRTAEPHKSNSKWGGFIDDVDKFDADFFQISRREAELMDPQHRLFLEHTWKAIEDAGYRAATLAGRKIGVFVGVSFNDYDQLLELAGESHPLMATGTSHALISNRVSYLLNLRGPSEAIDTACSSSLVAVHRAVKSIQNGESEMALAGGVSLNLTPTTQVGASQLGIISPDGRCKTFDASANGYVKGEGVAVILLKPLHKAVEDGDQIYAVIRGTASGHGGKANSLTAPNSESQAELLLAAFGEAEVGPDTLTYMETHGTGTQLGDPVEVEGLTRAFQAAAEASGISLPVGQYCGVGSVKTNIGHLEPAAGIAGLIKVVLGLRHALIPASLHVERLNPYLKLEGSPFYVADATRPWKRLQDRDGQPIPRRAGVSSFGFGGSYAHAVLEEYEKPTRILGFEDEAPQVVMLSARSEDRLLAYAKNLVEFLDEARTSGSYPPLAGLAYTLQMGRESMPERLAVVVDSHDALREALDAFAQGRSVEGLYRGRADVPGSVVTDETLYRKYQLSELARLWVKGSSVEWERLYGVRPGRVSLPTYPFARNRYWVESKSVTAARKNVNLLHPLVHQNTSSFTEQQFTSEWTGDEFFLAEHLVSGRMGFPPLSYLEMVSAAIGFAGGQAPGELRQVAWHTPFTKGEVSSPVRVSLYPEGDSVEFDVWSGSAERPTLHCRGTTYARPIEGNARRIDLPKVLAGMSTLSPTAYYDRLVPNGLEYGPVFRSMQELCTAGDEAVSKLVLPTADQDDRFRLHPALLEGVAQTIGALRQARHQDASGFQMLSVGRVRIYGTLTSGCFVHVKAVLGSSAGAGTYDICIVDESGNMLAELSQVSVRERVNQPKPDQNALCILEKLQRGDLRIDEAKQQLTGVQHGNQPEH